MTYPQVLVRCEFCRKAEWVPGGHQPNCPQCRSQRTVVASRVGFCDEDHNPAVPCPDPECYAKEEGE